MENSIILEEILEELTENAKHISSSSLEKFANEIIKARHIFVAGAGRSGFVARGFANRCIWGWKYSLWENRQHRQLKKKIFLLSVQVQEKLTV